MNRFLKKRSTDAGLQPMVFSSAVLHVMAVLIAANFHVAGTLKEAPAYYVDILDLPVAEPQSGLPAQQALVPPLPDTSPTSREMKLPAPSVPKTLPPAQSAVQPVAEAPVKEPESSGPKEFEERMARLQRDAEARHAAASLDALKSRVQARIAGTPGSAGSEAGSDYANYVQARLKDAFRTTISYQSKNPEVAVRILIGRNGHVVRVSTEKTSGDRVFEDSVSRAIAKADGSFPPPPSGRDFEKVFLFRPQGIGQL